MRTYTIDDFMKYIVRVLKVAALGTYSWHSDNNGAIQRSNILLKYLHHFGVIAISYQNIGLIMFIHFALVQQQNNSSSRNCELHSGANVTIVSENGIDCSTNPKTESELTLALVSETIAILCMTVLGSCKIWIFYRYQPRISALICKFEDIFPTAMEQQQQQQQQQEKSGYYRLEHYNRKMQMPMRLICGFSIFAYIFYNLQPLFDLMHRLFTVGMTGLTYRHQSNTWYPWHGWHVIFRYSPNQFLQFILCYLCELPGSLIGLAYLVNTEVLFYFFATQMQLQFDYLARSFEKLDATDDKNAIERLTFLIEYHHHLLDLFDEINEIFNLSFLMNFFSASLATCLMGTSMLLMTGTNAIKFSFGFIYYLGFTLGTCYFSSELTRASDRLQAAAFHGNWYNNPNPVYRKMILMFIIRTTRIDELKAYQFVIVSMATYSWILTFSYQMFTCFHVMSY